MSLSLGPNEIHLWQALSGDGGPTPDAQARCLALLGDAERKRYRGLTPGADPGLFLATRALERTVLALYLGERPESLGFCQDAKGRPGLTGAAAASGLDYNLTHARGAALLVVGRGARVGVDVERLDRQADATKLAGRFFAPEEAQAVHDCPPERRVETFLDFWTLKEACVKAHGGGLASGLAGFWIDAERIAPVVHWSELSEAPAVAWNWRFWRHRPSDEHLAAVAAAWPVQQAAATAPKQAILRVWSVEAWSASPEPVAIAVVHDAQ